MRNSNNNNNNNNNNNKNSNNNNNNNNNNDNNNNNNNNNNNIGNNVKMIHFDNYALTLTLSRRKLVRQISWFPKYTLYLHQELICYH